MSVIHDQICRLCAEINQSTEDILENNLKKMAELIYRYLSITVDTFAGISTRICLDCKEKILNFHNFALKCEHAQSFLLTHKTYANASNEYRELKSEFDLKFGIKEEKDIFHKNDIDCFDDVVGSPLSSSTETKINSENESQKKTTPSKKIKSKTGLSSSKLKTSKRGKSNQSETVFSTLLIEDVKVNDNKNDEKTNGNTIKTRLRSSRRCKSNTFKISSNLPKKEEKMDDNENTEETINNDYEDEMDDLDNIKGNQNDEITINGNVINTKKPIKDIAIVKEILKLSEQNEIDITQLELPPIIVKRARFSQMFNFDCHLCEMKFDEWRFLSAHTMEQHQTQPEVKCFCSKTLKNYSAVYNHFRIHSTHERKKYRCKQCDKKFYRKENLADHKKTHEPAEKRPMFECSMCDRKFSVRSALYNHVNSIHDKRFVCDLCGASFGMNTSLQNHIQTHGDEITCMCDICNRGFKTRLRLRIHMRRVHHSVSHTCPHCSKVLKSRHAFLNHLHIHDEIPRYSCPFCDKKFKTSSYMLSHKKIHMVERPYTCLWCPKTFTHPSNFRMHKIQAHEAQFREYELKMLQDKEEFTKQLREKLSGNPSKTDMENNVH